RALVGDDSLPEGVAGERRVLPEEGVVVEGERLRRLEQDHVYPHRGPVLRARAERGALQRERLLEARELLVREAAGLAQWTRRPRPAHGAPLVREAALERQQDVAA